MTCDLFLVAKLREPVAATVQQALATTQLSQGNIGLSQRPFAWRVATTFQSHQKDNRSQRQGRIKMRQEAYLGKSGTCLDFSGCDQMVSFVRQAPCRRACRCDYTPYLIPVAATSTYFKQLVASFSPAIGFKLSCDRLLVADIFVMVAATSQNNSCD